MTPEQIEKAVNSLNNGETIYIGKTELGSEGGDWTIVHPNGHVEIRPRDGFERTSAEWLVEWADEFDSLASAARIMGRRGGLKGGLATTDAKRAASAANGAKGGRPRKAPAKE